MDSFVIVFNSGDTPVLVGPKYVFPGQNQRVLRRHFDEAKVNHPGLKLSGKQEAPPEVPVEETPEEAPPEVPAEAEEE